MTLCLAPGASQASSVTITNNTDVCYMLKDAAPPPYEYYTLLPGETRSNETWGKIYRVEWHHGSHDAMGKRCPDQSSHMQGDWEMGGGTLDYVKLTVVQAGEYGTVKTELCEHSAN